MSVTRSPEVFSRAFRVYGNFSCARLMRCANTALLFFVADYKTSRALSPALC